MKRNLSSGGLDYFKIIAAFLVVAIHTSPLTSFHADADFIFTRIIARTAVPFFFMVTGYFVLPRYLFEHSDDFRPLLHFLRKNLLLYFAAILLYLPVNLYAGQLKEIHFPDLMRMLIFDGTFYHLWYLPASILGIIILCLMSRIFSFKATAAVSLLLYIIGLFGDSYYGFLTSLPGISSLYDKMFSVFSYTRNGIFYAPVFLIAGAWISSLPKKYRNKEHYPLHITEFILSFAAMLSEGIFLHSMKLQRHDSMYIFLIPCMFFLFLLLSGIDAAPARKLRRISTWIYIFHPLIIILLRGLAKAVHLEDLLINNSLIHYFAVCVLSCTAACIFDMLMSVFKNFMEKRKKGESKYVSKRTSLD